MFFLFVFCCVLLQKLHLFLKRMWNFLHNATGFVYNLSVHLFIYSKDNMLWRRFLVVFKIVYLVILQTTFLNVWNVMENVGWNILLHLHYIFRLGVVWMNITLTYTWHPTHWFKSVGFPPLPWVDFPAVTPSITGSPFQFRG